MRGRCGELRHRAVKRRPCPSRNVSGISSASTRRELCIIGRSRSPLKPAMSRQCSCGDRQRPCGPDAACRWPVTEPTDRRSKPPSCGFFSSSGVAIARASIAAASPLPPPPTTMTSKSVLRRFQFSLRPSYSPSQPWRKRAVDGDQACVIRPYSLRPPGRPSSLSSPLERSGNERRAAPHHPRAGLGRASCDRRARHPALHARLFCPGRRTSGRDAWTGFLTSAHRRFHPPSFPPRPAIKGSRS